VDHATGTTVGPEIVCLPTGFPERNEARTMHTPKSKRTMGWNVAAAVVWPTVTLLTGCQAEYAGQTLPSPYYLTDDVQYYAPGSEFKLAHEAAAMKEQAEAVQSRAQAAPVR
jgi:hypothetical protein